VRAGVIAGSIAAIVASVVNLPLEAPSDTLFNAATVTMAAVLAGAIAGLLWRGLGSNRRRQPLFAWAVVIAFIVTAAIAIVLDQQVNRAASYIVALAAIVLGIVGSFTPLLSRLLRARPTLVAGGALVIAMVVGVALASQGDAASGALTLPPRSTTINVIS
jgi:undecaprenyl pyrophosphate phosphatase UppP